MNYRETKAASKEIKLAIQSMVDGDKMSVTYPVARVNVGWIDKEFIIKAWDCGVSDSSMSYSIYDDSNFRGMNFNVKPTTLRAYTFDMMNQRTSFNFDLTKMKLTKQVI